MIPVLEIGGTHASACWADLHGRGSLTPVRRVHFEGDPDLAQFTRVVAELHAFLESGHGDLAAVPCAVAIPGPFDYVEGVGRFAGVGKFAALNGVDVRAIFAAEGIVATYFVNDADAFGLGEAEFGAGAGSRRVVCLTLGTGIGSAFVRDGQVVHEGPQVPPGGYLYRAVVGGKPVEDVMSRRAIVAAWRRLSGLDEDVYDVMVAARSGVQGARGVVAAALEGLVSAAAPYLEAFGAEVVVVGGSIARSWDLVEPALREGWERRGIAVPVLQAARPEEAPFLGAASAAVRR